MAELIKLSSRNDGLLMGTPGNDRLKGSAGHPQVDNGRRGVIKLLAGNDVITSRSDITLRGVVTLNEGDDVIQSGESTTLLGAYEGRSGNARICLGAGNDRMESEGEITSSAADLSAGKGDDQINGQAGFHQSYGTSAMGSGADSIIAGGSGLEAIDTYLRTGSGCDVIDVITGGAYLWFATVRMGADDDHLRVRGSLVVGAGAEINLGGGNDHVEATLVGEIWEGGGDLRLGDGDDRYRGFARLYRYGKQYSSADDAPRVWGGKGSDTMILPRGTYAVGSHQISNGEALLYVNGIEALEGVAGGRFAMVPGVLTVGRDGVATFNPSTGADGGA